NAIKLIEDARSKGVDITANQYPFIASMTSLKANLIPGWAQSGGNKAMVKRFDNPEDLSRIQESLRERSDESNKNVVIASKAEGFEDISGKSLYELSDEWGVEIEELVIRILKMNPGVSA